MTSTDNAIAAKRVLIVDDDRNLRKIIQTNLEVAGYNVVVAGDGVEAMRVLDSLRPDLIVLDVMMPGMDGYEVAKRIRSHPGNARMPIIMLTAKGEVEDKLAGFDAGIDDYIAKPFDPDELIARARANIRRVEAGAALSPLTRLPGNLAIEAELRRRIDAREPFAVLYLDLDNFKAFNDVYGFARGDEAIRLLARTCDEIIRRRGTNEDFVGHIGGDDFLIVAMPDRSERIARDIIDGFEREIRMLYSDEDRRRGYIETSDRQGNFNRFPLMSLSVAIVSNQHRELTNYAQIGQIAAELKRYAKSIGGSVYVKDKRRQ